MDSLISEGWSVVDILGLIGGSLIAISLAPQLYRSFKTRSTSDISYSWQIVYFSGLFILEIYALHYRLWPIFIPQAVEIVFIAALTAMKVYFEIICSRWKVSPKTTVSEKSIGDELECSIVNSETKLGEDSV